MKELTYEGITLVKFTGQSCHIQYGPKTTEDAVSTALHSVKLSTSLKEIRIG